MRVSLRLLDATIPRQLSDGVVVQLKDDKTGQIVRTERLLNSQSQPDFFTASFVADHVGNFTVSPLDSTIGNLARVSDQKMSVSIPKLELAEPQVDRTSLGRLAGQTGGQAITLDEAKTRLADLVPTAAQKTEVGNSKKDWKRLWDMPITLIALLSILTLEWIIRKICGMV